jgi:NADH dehydrogenase [ubiquinone] 1 alpha subcomplex assembly factor 7
VEAALYDPQGGFFAAGRGPGRAGADFVTSPEVGPLFGVLVARALDHWWRDLGHPDPFLVVEAGAGPGRLAREVLRAEPACGPALRYVLVDRSAAMREAQREHLTVEPAEYALGPAAPGDPHNPPVPVARAGPIVTALEELPARAGAGVVLANELLDNLPFDVVERTATGWREVRIGLDDDARFIEVPVPLPAGAAVELDAPVGTRLPLQAGVREWVGACGAVLHRGVLVAVDTMASVPSLVQRGPAGWLRTYRGHERGVSALVDPGSQDIACDVVLETLRRSARDAGFDVVVETPQAEWLRSLGIDELVEQGRDRWHERAQVGDLDALAARSRVTEAAALTDPAGLGAHTVVVLSKGLR